MFAPVLVRLAMGDQVLDVRPKLEPGLHVLRGLLNNLGQTRPKPKVGQLER